MTAKENYIKIMELVETFSEDFYDCGGGSIAMDCAINKLEALTYLKNKKPHIYKHICNSYEEHMGGDLDSMVVSRNPKLESIAHDEIFVFADCIEDKKIYKELSEFSDDGRPYKCECWELWQMVIALLGENFSTVQEVLDELFEGMYYNEDDEEL